MLKYHIYSIIHPYCICLDKQSEHSQLHYSRFAISPLLPGQANILGNAIRKVLLTEVKGSCITSVMFPTNTHEYANLPGVRENVYDILLNLRDIVLSNKSNQSKTGYIEFQGPGSITAKDIQIDDSVQIIDPTQYIAYVEANSKLDLSILVESQETWELQPKTNHINSIFNLDAKFTPIKNVNYNIYSIEEEHATQELLILEIWTNGSVSPEDALYKASYCLALLLKPLFYLHDTI
jgi:DNA-directed RNA polymerase subunit alpha